MLYTHCLFSTCFPGGVLALPLLLWVLRLAFSVWWYNELSAYRDLHWEEYDVDGGFLLFFFFFHTLENTWSRFCLLTHYYALSFLHSSSTLHPNLIYGAFLYIRFFFSLLPLKVLFAQLHVCVSLTVSELFVAVRPPVLSICLICYHPMLVLLFAASCVSALQCLCYHTRPVFLYTVSLC